MLKLTNRIDKSYVKLFICAITVLFLVPLFSASALSAAGTSPPVGQTGISTGEYPFTFTALSYDETTLTMEFSPHFLAGPYSLAINETNGSLSLELDETSNTTVLDLGAEYSFSLHYCEGNLEIAYNGIIRPITASFSVSVGTPVENEGLAHNISYIEVDNSLTIKEVETVVIKVLNVQRDIKHDIGVSAMPMETPFSLEVLADFGQTAEVGFWCGEGDFECWIGEVGDTVNYNYFTASGSLMADAGQEHYILMSIRDGYQTMSINAKFIVAEGTVFVYDYLMDEYDHSVIELLSNFGIMPLAGGSSLEVEPNDTPGSANTAYDNWDYYGRISSAYDVDWYCVTFTSPGYANFWLEGVPAGRNYDLEVYASNGTTRLAYSHNPGTANELIRLDNILANTNYFIKVYSASGYDTSNYYMMRTRCYPTLTSANTENDTANNSYGGADTLSDGVDKEWDFAVLVYDSSIGMRTGWFGMTTSNPPNLSTSLALTGYPAGRFVVDDIDLNWSFNKPQGSMWTHYGPILASSFPMQKYTINSTPGQSGSPIYDSQNRASAIYTQYDYTANAWSLGRRIDSDVMSITEYLNNNISTNIAFSQNTYSVGVNDTEVTVGADLTDAQGNIIDVQVQDIDVYYFLNDTIANHTGVFSTGDLISGLNSVYAAAHFADDAIIRAEAKIPYGTPGPASIKFSPDSYTKTIPVSNSVTTTVIAKVIDQYDNIVPNSAATYSLDQAYSGVSINSSTGVVTIGANAEPDIIIIKADYSTLPTAYTALKLSYEESIPTSIAFLNTPYSSSIPDFGYTTVAVTAQVKDQYGKVMELCSPTYSLLNPYSGVSVNGSTGEVTVQSSAVAGTAYVKSSYGILTVTEPLTLMEPLIPSDYTICYENLNELGFFDEYEGYFIDMYSPIVCISAYVLDGDGYLVEWPDLVSTVYLSDSGIQNTTGEFEMEELEIMGYGPTWVTVEVILSDNTIIQDIVKVELYSVPPLRR